MVYCSNCGTALDGAKYCQDCGTHVGSSVQTENQPIISQRVGIFRDLEPGETIRSRSQIPAVVIFVKEAEIKKIIGKERKEIPISISRSQFYFTSKSLIFLKLFEISSSGLGGNTNQLSSVSGNFYEIPLSAIISVEMKQVKINKNDTEKFIELFGGDKRQLAEPALEIIFDEKETSGKGKDYIDAMMQRGVMRKLWGKALRVSDKLFILDEQSVSILPMLQEIVRNRSLKSSSDKEKGTLKGYWEKIKHELE